jgi:hypothetical protein
VTKLFIGAVAVLLALAGCTTTPAPHGTATASASPTATLAATPSPALPLTCAQLFTIGAVPSHLHDPVAVKVDETHVGTYLEDLAVVQAGGTECTWGGTDMTDASYDTGVVLTILPSAGADFAKDEPPATSTTVTGHLGASSAYDCASGAWCYGDALAGTYWISFQLGDAGAANGPTGETVDAIMKPIVDAVASAGGAVAAWAKPTDSFDGAALCTAPGATALVSSALGAAAAPRDLARVGGILGAAARREGVATCSWATGPDNGINIQVLPGGSWVYPRVTAAPPLWTLIGHPSLVDVPGADGGALIGCGEHCEALFSVGKSVVHLDMGDVTDQATATALTQKLAVGAADG